MYVPPAFRVDDESTLLAFIEQHAFGTLVTWDNSRPFATHLPFLVDRPGARLVGHLARANPQWQQFDSAAQPALAIFQGPHAYISPAWYQESPAVPTWNYTAVHVTGVPYRLTDAETAHVVDELISKYERSRTTPWANALPDDYRRKMLAAIVGFALPLEQLEGKFKLGQNRSKADQEGVHAGLLAEERSPQRLADWLTNR